jgi:D-alanyl-D-alanine carboxypeptidase/D-alanyl-D-alanine-endopeptidase (penicillin-binding protein 4)
MFRRPASHASVALLLAAACAALPPRAQSQTVFEERLQAIMSRPLFRHSRFGIEFYSLDEGRVLYARSPQELFIPGSTTKILTVGTALELLGPDFRFHTRIYRAGEVGADGVLHGDLVMVAAGDPNLSGRIQPDGSLAFQDEDHSYGFARARPVPGDPLLVIRELARQVAAKGIRRVDGTVRVDATLFTEGPRELGTGVVISPIVVNDNLIDVTVAPGQREGDPATLIIAPQSRYVAIANQVKTVARGATELEWANDSAAAGGSRSATLTGTIALGASPKLQVYHVPVPSRFAEVVLTEALQDAGVQVTSPYVAGAAQFGQLQRFYTPDREMAEHVSPPLREAAKVILKVSQNLHASMLPYIVGAYLKKGSTDAPQAGFDLERAMLDRAGLDLTAAVQNDGAGGAALFAPDFVIHFLVHLSKQQFFPDFLKSLPVLGQDGTLAEIQVHSPAAGHVFAKTGTHGGPNALSGGGVINGKGLAGFVDTQDGHRLAFAAYINFVPISSFSEEELNKVGQAMGEIAAAAYDGFIAAGGAQDPKPARPK